MNEAISLKELVEQVEKSKCAIQRIEKSLENHDDTFHRFSSRISWIELGIKERVRKLKIVGILVLLLSLLLGSFVLGTKAKADKLILKKFKEVVITTEEGCVSQPGDTLPTNIGPVTVLFTIRKPVADITPVEREMNGYGSYTKLQFERSLAKTFGHLPHTICLMALKEN